MVQKWPIYKDQKRVPYKDQMVLIYEQNQGKLVELQGLMAFLYYEN